MAQHKTKVEYGRSRVVCLSCPWFLHDASLTAEQLRQRGFGHVNAAEPR